MSADRKMAGDVSSKAEASSRRKERKKGHTLGDVFYLTLVSETLGKAPSARA